MDPLNPLAPDPTVAAAPDPGITATRAPNKVDPRDAEIAALKSALTAVSAGLSGSIAQQIVAPPLAGPAQITKRDARNGLEQSLPAATWALLSTDETANFSDVVTQRPSDQPTV